MRTKDFKAELERTLETKEVMESYTFSGLECYTKKLYPIKYMPSVIFALELIASWPSDTITLKQLKQLVRNEYDEKVLKIIFAKVLSKKKGKISQ